MIISTKNVMSMMAFEITQPISGVSKKAIARGL